MRCLLENTPFISTRLKWKKKCISKILINPTGSIIRNKMESMEKLLCFL